MNNEFVTYAQALALKELGFDEDCIAGYQLKLATLFSEIPHTMNGNIHKNSEGITAAPLYQQSFRWFREKYGIKFHIREDTWNNWCYLNILSGEEYVIMGEYKSYEEAESACLDKLIEIIKNKNE